MIYRKRSFSRFRVLFAGSSNWSIEFLDLLLQKNFRVVGLLTPPDSRQGRGQKIVPSPIKQFALERNLPIFQPEKLGTEQFVQELKKLKPDLVFVASYGKFFPKKILEIPSFGFLNFHPSMLPEWRGPSPIQSAILFGKKTTGFSFMRLTEGMDDGPIIFQKEVRIKPRETALTLAEKLVAQGKKELINILRGYLENNINFQPKNQRKKGVSFSKIFTKESGRLDWQNETAEEIDCKIRALNPQIKTFCFWENESVRSRILLSSSVGLAKDFNLNYGEYKLLRRKKNIVLAVKAKEGVVLIDKVRIEGKNECSANDFFQGHQKGKMA